MHEATGYTGDSVGGYLPEERMTDEMKKTRPVPFQQVEITDGFWARRQELNARKTLWAVKDRFEKTGRFDAFRFDWREGMPNKPFLYWVGDIEKWIESAAYILEKEENPALEEIVDRLAEQIERQQGESGYYHVWFSAMEPSRRWTSRSAHELYTAGHLMEAAVAYYEATGKNRLLNCACRFADEIERVFVRDQEAAFVTPGHEEIELALVKLYRCTGEKRYLELSRFFVEQRGNNEKDQPVDGWLSQYEQDHLPVREQETAEGHAVRAVYLYSGMADLAYEYEDESLLNACRRLFHNIADRRMYVTGGIGSSARDEGFTIDYDLPNLTAYSETCAGIGLMFFAARMLKLETDSFYADVAERVLYNAFLSSTSLDGTAFFYENPIELDPRLLGRDVFAREPVRMPSARRVKVFNVSCCPPNITRFVASLGGMLYTCGEDDGTLYVHQYMDSRAEVEAAGKVMTVTQKTAYPNDGTVTLTVENPTVDRLAVRIPGWCRDWSVEVNGAPLSLTPKKGYVCFACPQEGETVTLRFAMPPVQVEAHPAVRDAAGKVALQRGPLVYCLEGVDNGENLRDIRLDSSAPVREVFNEECQAYELHTAGWRREAADYAALYRPVGARRVEQPLRFIPYFAFANREECEMIVWVNEQGSL